MKSRPTIASNERTVVEVPPLRSKTVAWIGLGTTLVLVVAAFLVFRSCGGLARTRARPGVAGVEVITLKSTEDVRGLSGLSIDGDGNLWAVPEEGGALVRIDGSRARAAVVLSEMPEDLELEALAWIEGRRFAIGTEASDEPQRVHRIYRVDGASGRAELDDWIPIDARQLGVDPVENEGVEGLCHAGGVVLAALETPIGTKGHRYAALGRRRLSGGGADSGWAAHRVRLTSETGKLSALDCQLEDDHLVVYAVERHYQVMHLVRFEIPLREPPGKPIRAVVVRDLRDSIHGSPNFEGLVVRGGVAWLLVDNHYGSRTGPNELVRMELSGNR